MFYATCHNLTVIVALPTLFTLMYTFENHNSYHNLGDSKIEHTPLYLDLKFIAAFTICPTCMTCIGKMYTSIMWLVTVIRYFETFKSIYNFVNYSSLV